MEQDIRELFNTEHETEHQLPLTHKAEFQDKLRSATHKKSRSFNWLFKYAAITLLFLTVGYISIQQFIEPSVIKETSLQLQLKEVEQQYLDHINKEWESFKSLTNDNRLIDRYEQKLEELNIGYQELSIQFQDDTNNILVLESLIENLKLRLQILKDIQQHIKLLNQKNEQNEIII